MPRMRHNSWESDNVTQRVRVALGQVRPVLGDVPANVDKHLQLIEKARSERAGLIVFPELGLTGYQVQDLALDVACRRTDKPVQTLVDASRDIDVVFSFVEESDEHLFFVSSVYASGGEIRDVHRKVYLPTYGMFDEGRYFARGRNFRAFPTSFGKVGMLICEDAWHVSSPYLLSLAGADVMLLSAASPARSVTEQEQFGSQRFWRELLEVYARLFGVFIVFVNRVGFEDGINFFGGSGIVSPLGEWIVEAPSLEEAIVLGEMDLATVRQARFTTPILRDEDTDMVLRSLQRLVYGTEERNPW
jgi:predicted amidohydrolase